MSKEAMRLALEALKVDAYVYNGEKSWVAIKALEEALAKQKQGEPVAWLEGETIYWKEDQGLNDWIRKNGEPLYTTPQQRTWVGLTLDERDHLWEVSRAGLPRYNTFAGLVESKLKEKNT